MKETFCTEIPLPRAFRRNQSNCGYADRNCYKFSDYHYHLHTGKEELTVQEMDISVVPCIVLHLLCMRFGEIF